MQRKINLSIKDSRDSFNGHRKKPYFLFIEYGSKNFVFSNKDKANRFLTKFKNGATSIFLEMGQHLSFLYSININLATIQNYSSYLKNSNGLDVISKRYSFVLTNKYQDIAIGREVNNFYYELDSQYIYYRDFLQQNARNNFLLNQIRIKMKSIRRLRRDLDLLLSDASGVNELSNIEILSIDFKTKMSIA